MKPDRYLPIKIAVISGLIVLLVYLQALAGGFVIFDDPLYILNNPVITSLGWDHLVSMFTHPFVNWWMPLTWISFAIDYRFWGFNPFGYHLTNIVLHAVNTGLVVLIANRVWIQSQRSEGIGEQEKLLYPAMLLIAGLLWGIHPLRVESVAWVAERKDVLNGFFVFGAVLSYLHHVQLKESGQSGAFSRFYILTLVLFILSLMAKSVSVVFPAILLVLDWYPLGRLRQSNYQSILLEKAPFFVVSAVMSVATIYFISDASYLISNEDFPLAQRIVVSGNALIEYCRLLVYPIGIVPLHLIPDPIPFAYSVKAVIAIVLMVVCVSVGKERRGRTVVLFCFVLSLLPVLAFFQNGAQAYASRFTYLPSVAPCIAAAFAAVTLFRNMSADQRLLRIVLSCFVVLLLLFYVSLSQRLISVWQNSETMWNRIVELEPSAITFKERASLYVKMGKFDAAVEGFSAAIRNPIAMWQPYLYNLYALRGEALFLAGRYDEAVKDFSTAIAMSPHPVYYHFRGIALKESGRTTAAEDDFRKAGGETGPIIWYWIKAGTQVK